MTLRGQHAPLDYHRTLLDDGTRMVAWDRAIRAVIRPGDVVLDAGAGTGVLGMLAARAGARVHAVESTEVVDVCRELVARNGLAGRMTVHHADLCAMTPIEPVDVVLCDFMGRFLPDGVMYDAVAAAGRWLRPGGRFLPERIDLRVAPVGDLVYAPIARFERPLFGLDLSPALPRARAVAGRLVMPAAAVLASPVDVGTLVPPVFPRSVDVDATFEIGRAGLLCGVAGWFTSTLAPGVVIDTAPGRFTSWGQTLWPVARAAVKPGDVVRFRLHAESVDDVRFTWSCDASPDVDANSVPSMSTFDPSADEAVGIELLARRELSAALPCLLRALDGSLTSRKDALAHLGACLWLLGRQDEATEAVTAYVAVFGPHPLVPTS